MQSKKTSTQSKKTSTTVSNSKSQQPVSVKPAAHNHSDLEKEISMLKNEVVDLKKLVSDLLNTQNQSRNLEVDIAMIKNELNELASTDSNKSELDDKFNELLRLINICGYLPLRKAIRKSKLY